MRKLVAKPLDIMAGVAGGLVAGLVFRHVWHAVTGDDDAPDSTDTDRGWGEVLAAAALQGALYALAKAAFARAGAATVRRAVVDTTDAPP